jgi:soluble lytic murein transglycosylase
VKPAPPGPVYLSQADYNRMELFLEALKGRKWSLADTYRQQVQDPVGRSVADWAWINADPGALSWQEVGTFLDNHPDWPLADRHQRNAEQQITDNASPDAVLAFYRQRQPVSGKGKRAAALALIANGRVEEAKDYLRAAWVEHDWSTSDERRFVANYGQYLSPADHAAKADRQLFEIKATATKRLLPYLTGGDKRMAAARIALLRRDSNAVSLLNNLSADQKKDSGVLHAATRYYRRGDNEPTAIAYARQAPLNAETIRNTERWWTERRLLARWALKNGRYEDAYAMAAFSGLTEGGSFADAEFMAGWLALRFLQDPAKAKPHFAYLDAGVTAPISKARAQYWLGRTFEAEGAAERAVQHYDVAAAYPFTYYGQLAFERTSNSSANTFPAAVPAREEEKALFSSRPLVHAMRILAELDQDRHFIAFARALDDQLQTPGEYVEYERFMMEQGKVFLSVRAGKVAVKNGADAPHVSYPLIYVPKQAQDFAEHALILALSRQESEFNPRAYSSARARGLMQLLASTAKITARKEGFPYNRARLMDDPNYNMVIGAAHLSHLLERFDGSYIMTLAGYNAGPHRVDRWIGEYGDPRQPDVDPVDWVEMIPFSETRNYVQRVMENVQIYRARLYDQPIAGALARDLVRGGGTITAIGIDPPSPVLDVLSQQQRPLQMSYTDYGTPPASGTKVAMPVLPETTPAVVEVESTAPSSSVTDDTIPMIATVTPVVEGSPPAPEPSAPAFVQTSGGSSAVDLNEGQLTDALNQQMLEGTLVETPVDEERDAAQLCTSVVSYGTSADDLNNAMLQGPTAENGANC